MLSVSAYVVAGQCSPRLTPRHIVRSVQRTSAFMGVETRVEQPRPCKLTSWTVVDHDIGGDLN